MKTGTCKNCGVGIFLIEVSKPFWEHDGLDTVHCSDSLKSKNFLKNAEPLPDGMLFVSASETEEL